MIVYFRTSPYLATFKWPHSAASLIATYRQRLDQLLFLQGHHYFVWYNSWWAQWSRETKVRIRQFSRILHGESRQRNILWLPEIVIWMVSDISLNCRWTKVWIQVRSTTPRSHTPSNVTVLIWSSVYWLWRITGLHTKEFGRMVAIQPGINSSTIYSLEASTRCPALNSWCQGCCSWCLRRHSQSWDIHCSSRQQCYPSICWRSYDFLHIFEWSLLASVTGFAGAILIDIQHCRILTQLAMNLHAWTGTITFDDTSVVDTPII